MSGSVRQVSIWFWPLAAIVLVAVAGQLFGLLGAVIAASSGVAALAFSAAEMARTPGSRRNAAFVSIGSVVVVLALFAMQGAVPLLKGFTDDPRGPVDIRGLHVAQSDLDGDDLRGALLSGADLTDLGLRGRDMAGVQAAGAVLRGADLTASSLRGADLRGADLTGACLADADLTGADLAGSKVDGATITVPIGTVTSGTPLAAPAKAASCGSHN